MSGRPHETDDAGLEALEPLADLLERHGLAGATEEPFPNDGWSGATLTRLRDGDGRSFILKRTSLESDWIARATADRPLLREAWFATRGPDLPWPVRAPYLGAGRDLVSGDVGILSRDLSGILFDWNAPLSIEDLDRVLSALAVLHRHWWGDALDAGAEHWTPWRERLTLLTRPSLERRGPAGRAVGDRLLPWWDAWDRLATPAARSIIADLSADPLPLLDALASEPWKLLHGDLKLANAGIAADGAVELVDWQMTMVAPVAIDLGWLLVSNVNALPLPAGEVLDRYRVIQDYADRVRLDPVEGQADVSWFVPVIRWQTQVDLAILVGLLLRGWRKGADAEAGLTLGSGESAADDLAWWCERAVEATRSLA